MIWSQRGGGGGGGGGEMAGVVMECSYRPHLRIHLTAPRPGAGQQQPPPLSLLIATPFMMILTIIYDISCSCTLYITLCCVGVFCYSRVIARTLERAPAAWLFHLFDSCFISHLMACSSPNIEQLLQPAGRPEMKSGISINNHLHMILRRL